MDHFFTDEVDHFPSDVDMQGYELERLPIPVLDTKSRTMIAGLVDQLLAAKDADLDADTSALELEIDRRVYDLYGLTEEEIAVVESQVGG